MTARLVRVDRTDSRACFVDELWKPVVNGWNHWGRQVNESIEIHVHRRRQFRTVFSWLDASSTEDSLEDVLAGRVHPTILPCRRHPVDHYLRKSYRRDTASITPPRAIDGDAQLAHLDVEQRLPTEASRPHRMGLDDVRVCSRSGSSGSRQTFDDLVAHRERPQLSAPGGEMRLCPINSPMTPQFLARMTSYICASLRTGCAGGAESDPPRRVSTSSSAPTSPAS